MCYYICTICESCKSVTNGPPIYCEKLQLGIICSKPIEEALQLQPLNNQLFYNTIKQEVQLYELLNVSYKWTDYTECICGLIPEYLYGDYNGFVSESSSGEVDLSGYVTEYLDNMECETFF